MKTQNSRETRGENAKLCLDTNAQHFQPSSPGSDRATQYSEASVKEMRGPGVLDRPIKSGDDSFLWSKASPQQPYGRAASPSTSSTSSMVISTGLSPRIRVPSARPPR
jgi:hypothetical protein